MASLLTDRAWTRVTTALHGLLSLRGDHSVPRSELATSAWLTLNLRLLRGREALAKMRAALSATALLCLVHDHVQHSPRHAEVLCKHVLASSMMNLPVIAGDPHIGVFVEESHTLKVMLDLSGVSITRDVMLELLSFLQLSQDQVEQQLAEIAASTSGSSAGSSRTFRRHPTVIGLRFSKCRLKLGQLELLQEMLEALERCQQQRAESEWLVCTVLGCLDLSENAMTAVELRKVAELVASKQIEELRMENVFARVWVKPNVDAFRHVVRAALLPQASTRHVTTPVRLLLGRNALDARYLQAILDTLMMESCRPLAMLGLPRTMSILGQEDRQACWRILAAICLARSNSHCMDHPCELDLSGNPISPDDISMFHQTRVENTRHRVEAVSAALEQGKSILVQIRSESLRCEPHVTADLIHDALDNTDLVTYTVTRLQNETWLGVVTPAVSEPQIGWVEVANIHRLDIADEHAWSWRFNRLRLDDLTETYAACIPRVLAEMGENLLALSLRHIQALHTTLPHILQQCPRLQHLNLEGCRIWNISLLWHLLRNGAVPNLQSLNLNGNSVGADAINEFRAICAAVPTLRLRELTLTQNSLGTPGIIHLGEILQTNRTLELIEIDGIMAGTSHDYAVQCQELDSQYQHQRLGVRPLAIEIKITLLCAIRQQLPRTVVDEHVSKIIFSMAASSVVRRILWQRS